jgi:hypothetical protein
MAQIISNVDFGFHNRDLQVANARLSAEGSWKKQRIAWIIPAGESINSKVYVAHRGLIFPPNQAMAPLLIEGAEVGAAFDTGIQMILNHPDLSTWEYVLSIEHDNIPEPTGVMKLLRAMEANPQFDAISGLYWTKGEGGVPQIWGDINDSVENFRPQLPQPGKVVECWGLGMGFCLYRMSMFKGLREKKVPLPWFKTVGLLEGDNGVGTQDLFFWGRVARPNGYRCAVDCNTLVGHLDLRTGISW